MSTRFNVSMRDHGARLVLAFLIAVVGPANAQEASGVARQVLQHQPWVAETLACPVAAMPKPEILQGIHTNTCQPGQRGLCLKKCTAGNANACYWLAIELQADHADEQAAEALFQRACTFGLMSACTNRAAGLLAHASDDPSAQKCAAQTFSTACAAADPWACTMYASLLVKGKGVVKNDDLALEVLEKSCKYGPSDPACSGATVLKASILAARRDGPRK